jgi:hypothetical protein
MNRRARPVFGLLLRLGFAAARVVAAAVAALSIAAFIGGEKIEKILGGRADASGPSPARKAVFASLVALAVVAIATLGLPLASSAQ